MFRNQVYKSVLQRAGMMIVVFVALSGFAGAQTNGQASLVLDGNIEIRNVQNHAWTLEKTGVLGTNRTINWTVTATKDPLGVRERSINVYGVLNVTNAGSKPALIGNIVLNLQKRTASGAWASAAANIVNATQEDAATTANVAFASTETTAINQAEGAGNYTSAGLYGVFTEKPGSGNLSLANGQQQGLTAMAAQGGIQPGQTVALFFVTSYNNALLNLNPGVELRLEALVTFANAGLRGNGGASANNVDINGNGLVDAAEATVRTVACRIGRTLPALTDVNNQVELTDTQANLVVPAGASIVSYSTTIGGGTGVAQLSNTNTFTVTTGYSGTSGTVINCAQLRSVNGTVSVQNGNATATFSVASAVELEACATVVVLSGRLDR